MILLDKDTGDLRETNSCWMNLFEGVASVVHLAGNSDPSGSFEETGRDNIISLINVLDASQRHDVKQFIYASSIWADYEKWKLADATTWYTASKIAGEFLVQAWAEQNKKPATCLRLSFYNPNDLTRLPDLYENSRLNDKALINHFNNALDWSYPWSVVRYAVGSLS